MSYVDDAFARLKSNLEITQTEEDAAIRRHHAIRDHVREKWDLSDDFLTGSYRRETKTKPLKDVDIFLVIDDDGAQGDLRDSSPQDVLNQLQDVLLEKYDSVTIDRMACVVSFGADEKVASFEVVPAFKRSSGGYLIPDASRQSWIATNPKTHHELSTAKNESCNDNYVPLVKMLKGLNREADEPVSPSFLLETMALEVVKAPFGSFQDETRWFLATAADRIHESWPDPARLGPDVNAEMTSPQKDKARQALLDALGVAEEAIRLEDEGRERPAVEEWRRLFGPQMPRP